MGDMSIKSAFLVTTSSGTLVKKGFPSFDDWDSFRKETEEVKLTKGSKNGVLIAIAKKSELNILDTRNGALKCSLPVGANYMTISQTGAFCYTWENPGKNTDNVKIWNLSPAPTVARSFKLGKLPSFEFSKNEKLFGWLNNGIVQFYDTSNFETPVTKTPNSWKIKCFSISPHEGKTYFASFIPSSKSGAPSFARIFEYPNMELVASKSFFQADRVDMKWNNKGTAVLLVTSSDVDKTGQSYYGKSMLHYLDIKGESAVVQTESESPNIHAAEWNPCAPEFCIITGKMPRTRAALMNSKCEITFDMGIEARNNIYFNPQGTIVLLAAFGNLGTGNIEVWEIKRFKRFLVNVLAPATTQLSWLNDGLHFVTASCAPRMQVENGFIVWDIKGNKCVDYKAPKHIFGIETFHGFPPPSFCEDFILPLIKDLEKTPKKQNQNESKKPVAYVPPSRRSKNNVGSLKPKAEPVASARENQLSETEKKIRNIRKKLDQIDKIKAMMKEGKPVEKNQLEKIDKAQALVEEMEKLELDLDRIAD